MNGFLGTKADFWWDVTLTSETIVVIAFVLGWIYGRRHQGVKHQKAMLAATVLVTAWLAMYFTQQAIAGLSGFDGPKAVLLYVYRPTLIFHSLVSTLAVLLSAIQIWSGFKSSRLERGERVLTGRGASVHRRLGKVTLLSYLMSIVTAYMIYTLLFVLYAPLRTPEYSAGESVGILTAIVAAAASVLVGGGLWLSRKGRMAAPQ
jgi:putative membrane protein